MNIVRSFALAAVAGVGAAAQAMIDGTPQGEVIGILPMIARHDTCDELPKLCTGPVMMYGSATILTYLCPETTIAHMPSTTHVTITKTVTVPPPQVETTEVPTGVPTKSEIAPAPATTEEEDTTTTVHLTLTQYTTITLSSNTHVPTPVDPVSAPAVPITGYLSATMPTELLSVAPHVPTETEEPGFTVQTSTPATTSTSGYDFPSMFPPVVNGTTTGIFYSEPCANSSLVQPTPFFPNTTSAHSHYALPTLPSLNVANRAADATETVKGSAGHVCASLVALSFSLLATMFVL